MPERSIKLRRMGEKAVDLNKVDCPIAKACCASSCVFFSMEFGGKDVGVCKVETAVSGLAALCNEALEELHNLKR